MFACSWPSQQDNYKASWRDKESFWRLILSLHDHLVFEWYHLYSYPFLWPIHGHPSEVNPNKWLWLIYLFSQLHLGWGIASPAGQTDPAGRAHGNWAVRTQPRLLLYLTCNMSPSTTCTLLPLMTYCSKHHTARVLLPSQDGQKQAGQTHSWYSTSFISLENHFLSASIGRREQMYHV